MHVSPLDPQSSWLQNSGLVEFPTCTYNIYTKSSAACGVQGDPYTPIYITDTQKIKDRAVEFGFTVLGSFLTIVVYYL